MAMDPHHDPRRLRRANLRLAWLLGLVAVGFLVGFILVNLP
jgi:hypothetical protein